MKSPIRTKNNNTIHQRPLTQKYALMKVYAGNDTTNVLYGKKALVDNLEDELRISIKSSCPEERNQCVHQKLRHHSLTEAELRIDPRMTQHDKAPHMTNIDLNIIERTNKHDQTSTKHNKIPTNHERTFTNYQTAAEHGQTCNEGSTAKKIRRERNPVPKRKESKLCASQRRKLPCLSSLSLCTGDD